MPDTPQDHTHEAAEQPSAFKRALTAITAKKNRGFLAAAVVALLGIAGIIFAVVGQDSDEDLAEPEQPQVEVEVPTDTASADSEPVPDPVPEPEAPEDTPAPEDRVDPEDQGNTPDSSQDEEPAEDPDEPNPADYPPGNPANRAGLPEEFPLHSSFSPANTETVDGKTVINATVSDPEEAMLILDYNLLQHYNVIGRNVDDNYTSGRWDLNGPGLPEGSVVVVAADGTFKVRIAAE